MNAIKILLVLLATLAMSTQLVACSGGDDSATAE